MTASLESHRVRYSPEEWQRIMKVSALYTHSLLGRVPAGSKGRIPTTGEILGLTLTRVNEGHAGYVFKDSDILFFLFLCRCCRKTFLSLAEVTDPDGRDDRPDGDTCAKEEALTEYAALQFLQRRQSLGAFLAFIKARKLKGKLRAYTMGFAKYGEERWSEERIAKDLRVTPAAIAAYRSRLREFLEDFELHRVRRTAA
jgi:hypothetical protein